VTAKPEHRGFMSFLKHPFHKPEPKPVQGQTVCLKGPCKDKPTAADPDLKGRKVCLKGPCQTPCPSGQVAGEGGTCAPAPTRANLRCQPNEVWNGTACEAEIYNCRPQEYWDGARCVERGFQCGDIRVRALAQRNEIRSIRADLQMKYESAMSRYRLLMNEALAQCESILNDLTI
jgi:hypothetical protein